MKFACLRYPKIEMTFKPDVKKEIDGVVIHTQREVIKFENGFYDTNDQKKIDFIKRHVDFGNGNICVVEEETLQEASPEELKIVETHKTKGKPKKV